MYRTHASKESYSVIIQVLRGETSDYIKYNDYDKLTTHGLMKDYTTSELNHLIDELRFKGFLNENDEILICDESVKSYLTIKRKYLRHHLNKNPKKKSISIQLKV